MDFDIRPATGEDLDDVVRTVAASYGEHAGEENLADARSLYELDRTLAAFDGHGRPVGAAAAVRLDVTVPGGAAVPAAAFVAIGVLPTHRRRGVLTALMDRHREDSRSRGEVAAVLIASEGGVYRRFGYGVATLATGVEVDTADAAFLSSPPAGGELRLLPPEEAAIVLPDVYDAYRRRQPGEVSRSDRFWDVLLRRAADLFVVAADDGYATYRIREGWAHGRPAFVCGVEEIVAESPAGRTALWRFLLDLDLVSVVRAGNIAPDEPLRWLLADPRALRTTQVRDMLWLRLDDIPAALSARRYAADARVVIGVAGEGRYRLDGGECRPAPGHTPDLGLGLADLGAVYLGGVSLAALSRAGRVVELSPGAVARADALFRWDPPPHCVTDF